MFDLFNVLLNSSKLTTRMVTTGPVRAQLKLRVCVNQQLQHKHHIKHSIIPTPHAPTFKN